MELSKFFQMKTGADIELYFLPFTVQLQHINTWATVTTATFGQGWNKKHLVGVAKILRHASPSPLSCWDTWTFFLSFFLSLPILIILHSAALVVNLNECPLACLSFLSLSPHCFLTTSNIIRSLHQQCIFRKSPKNTWRPPKYNDMCGKHCHILDFKLCSTIVLKLCQLHYL